MNTPMQQPPSDTPVSGPGISGQQQTTPQPGHKHRYKNVGLDSQELRRRREEEGIQLRKQKREQQLFKRRNVTTDDILQVSILLVHISIPLCFVQNQGSLIT